MGQIRITNLADLRFRQPSGVCVFDYGNPNEAGVLEQWIFEEASGDIVGRTNNTTLSATGTPDYQQTASGDHECLSPGIQVLDAEYFSKDGDDPNLDIGTGAFTFEFWGSVDAGIAGHDGTVLDCKRPTTFEGFLFFCDINNLGANFEDEEGNTSSGFASYDSLTAGDIHKWRITDDGTRGSGSIDLVLDGDDKGSFNMTNVQGDDLQAHNVYVGARHDVASNGSREFLGKMYEMRLAAASVNSGGPNGG